MPRFNVTSRRKILRRSVPWLLLLALLLRSLVAPGYEIANTGEDGKFSLGIVWCPGLNGVNLINGLDQKQSLDDHGHDHQHESAQESSDQNTGASAGDHFAAACGLWTGNSITFVTKATIQKEYIQQIASGLYFTEFSRKLPSSFYRNNHSPRAPPRRLFTI